MRTLTQTELAAVAGGAGECTAESSGNTYSGVSETGSFGDDLINLYEGTVLFTSHVIERVADSF